MREKTAIRTLKKLRRSGIWGTFSLSVRNFGFVCLVLFIVGFSSASVGSSPVSPELFPMNSSPSPPPAARECVWTGIDKIIAVGDLHGDYDDFLTILQENKLIDEGNHWTGGKTHLVQTGDVMDRGPDAKKILDLIRALEKEAQSAGGMVHFLIGNHEEMNILGLSFRNNYVTAAQFSSFLPKEYIETKEAKFKAKEGNGGDLGKLWEELLKDGAAQDLYTQTFNENYGRWIAEHNAVIKINDTVFLHAGFSEQFSTWKLETLNSVMTKELKNFIDDIKYRRPASLRNARIVYNPAGPLWYRDLVTKDEGVMEEEFDRILANLGAKSMVVAHTPLQSAVALQYMHKFGNRLFMIDTNISLGEDHLSALIIEKGEFHVWPPEKKTPRSDRRSRDAFRAAERKVNHEKAHSGDDLFAGPRLFREGHPPF